MASRADFDVPVTARAVDLGRTENALRLATAGRNLRRRGGPRQRRGRHTKAKKKLGKKHLKVSRQRKDHAIKAARCVAKSNDFIAYEHLKVKNMVKNKRLSKSINDAGWYQFRVWLEYYGKVYGKITVAVPPEYTSQECSNCGEMVKKALCTRTHLCRCGLVMDRDETPL